jgi:hypothetical protein
LISISEADKIEQYRLKGAVGDCFDDCDCKEYPRISSVDMITAALHEKQISSIILTTEEGEVRGEGE